MIFLLFSIAVLFHELGHFLVAKCFGVRVKRFCLFYDLGFCLFSTGKRFATEYRLGWLPIGGYVSFATSEDGDEGSILTLHPLKRIVIYLAGVTVNLLLVYCSLFGWLRNYVIPEPQFSHTYVMQETCKLTLNRLDDFRHALIETYITGSQEEKVSPPESRNKSETAKSNRAARPKRSISKTDGTIKDMLWGFSCVNIMLFLFNLLPIPPLDGAQCMFSLYELIVGKPVNERLRIILILAGSVLLVGLLCFDLYSYVLN